MFLLSKLFGLVTDPAALIYALLITAGVLIHVRRGARLGRRLLVAVLAAVTLVAVIPLDDMAARWFEERFPAPAELPERVDGIIVLGGAIMPAISASRGQVAAGGALTRMTALIPLARRYPEARLIFSGGSGDAFDQSLKEADYAVQFYRDIGFPPERIVFERQSRNTRENAVLSKEIMAPKPGETWLLITSAGHMMRSVGCFRAVGWPVVPVPVDYRTIAAAGPWWRQLRFSPARGFVGMTALIHEAMGLVSYRLMGWTESLLPAP